MIKAYLIAALIIGIYATLWYIIALFKKRNDVADIAWGLGYIILCVYFFFTEEKTNTALLVYGLVTLWGLRLAIHIGTRNQKKEEDFRYKNWRREWGQWFYIRSYLQVFLLQGLLLLIIAVPILISGLYGKNEWTILTFAGIGLWLIGFYFQTVGDYQLSHFKENRKSKEEVIQTGLWKYSRHPNYFGEIAMWWGIFLIILPLENGWWGIISPITITLLLVFVSGVPMMERRYRGNEAFEDYKKRTSVLIPWFPKQKTD